jgi:hypothetical protein
MVSARERGIAMKITANQRKAINAFARRQCSGIFAYCEATSRVSLDENASSGWELNLAEFARDLETCLENTDLADFEGILGKLRDDIEPVDGRVIIDMYVYSRNRVGDDVQLDSDVQAMWQDGKLVALKTSGKPTVWLEEPVR